MNTKQIKKKTEAKSTWRPSELSQKLSNAHHLSRPSLGAERAFHYTEFYKKQASQYNSPEIRRAKCLANHLERRGINIYDHELIVGTHTEHRIGAICHAELAGNFMLEDLTKFEKRKTNPLYLTSKVKRDLALKVFPYWLGKNLISKAFPLLKGIKYTMEQLNPAFFIINEAGGIAHFLPDYEDLINLGINGLRDKIIQNQKELKPQSEKQKNSLEANRIALDAFENFILRYKDLARQKSDQELETILSNISGERASSLREALQLIWFYQIVIQIESMDQGISLGRIDQYLYPLYQKEKKEGCFDEVRFKDLLCAFSLKLSEVIPLFSERVTELYGGLPSGQAATIGGINAKGEDAVNELSYMFLDVMDKFKTRQPNWHTRVNHVTNPEFYNSVMEVIVNGGGSPALYNDDIILPAMEKRGCPTNKVWNYATVGCVEPALPGESFTSSDAALFNLPIILELVLGNGYRLTKKIKIGRIKKRPDMTPHSKISSLEQLLNEIDAEMKHQIGYLKECLDRIERANAEHFPTPFSSLTVKGCIEQGTDLSNGGALYNASGIQGVGLADLANSVAAINELAFEKKVTTLAEIVSACRDNFQNQETLQSRLLNVAKFGNDQTKVDKIAQRLSEIFNRHVSANTNTRGGRWMPGFYSMTCHQAMGRLTAALPSGRLKGKPLADGIAPTDGSDVSGPTAVLNSISQLDHRAFGNGINLNLKFDAGTIKGKQGATILGALTRGYFNQKGMQVQINVLDPEALKEAQRNPELHKNLLVRVSGYCAHFVDLTPETQDEIIRRTLM